VCACACACARFEQVEAQNEKTLAMRETFDTNHFELRKSLERSQKEAMEAQSEGLSELIEDIEAKIEPTAQKAAQEAMDASQKEFEGARLAMREEVRCESLVTTACVPPSPCTARDSKQASSAAPGRVIHSNQRSRLTGGSLPVWA
jgi:hypothetical protein